MPLADQGGELVAVLRGAKAPLLQKMIVEELSREKVVLEHGGERKAVRKRPCSYMMTKDNRILNTQCGLIRRVFGFRVSTEGRLYRSELECVFLTFF